MRQRATLARQPFYFTTLRNIWLKTIGRRHAVPTAKLRKRDAVGNLRELAEELGLS